MNDTQTRPEKVIVVIHETLWQSVLSDVWSFSLIAALIGIGVYLNSSAMQWAGFLLAAAVLASNAPGRKSRTAQETADYLRDEFGVTASVRAEGGVK